MSQDEGKESGVTDTPFKAGETYRTREEVRTEVLRLAFARCGQTDPRPWRTIADELWTWVSRSEDRPEIPVAPTPPADDLAAAGAEIERLRVLAADLTTEMRGIVGAELMGDAKSDAGQLGGTVFQMWVRWEDRRRQRALLARAAALLPSPPDAKAADCRRCQGSGAEPPHEDVECKECGGTGRRSAKPAPERERLKGWCWVNVHSYGHASASERRHLADEYAEEDARTYGPRIACIPVDLSQHHVGEGLEP